ncbi:MAG: hypothetical protein C4554_01250 [Dethiobacter sp.]|jgi:hypothetical protein|nr:MAG: hypothetical protein C4554_01250 [Dethiobacter sp.]
MYLAFYFSLKRINESLMVIALLFGFLGIAAYLSSNTAFEMLSLSNLYYNATLETTRAMYLAAGQAMLSTWQGTAFDTYYVLNAITLIIIASVMFKSSVYSKNTATIGLISGVLMVIPSTAGTSGFIFALASLIPWTIFAILVAIKFLQLGDIGTAND